MPVALPPGRTRLRPCPHRLGPRGRSQDLDRRRELCVSGASTGSPKGGPRKLDATGQVCPAPGVAQSPPDHSLFPRRDCVSGAGPVRRGFGHPAEMLRAGADLEKPSRCFPRPAWWFQALSRWTQSVSGTQTRAPMVLCDVVLSKANMRDRRRCCWRTGWPHPSIVLGRLRRTATQSPADMQGFSLSS